MGITDAHNLAVNGYRLSSRTGEPGEDAERKSRTTLTPGLEEPSGPAPLRELMTVLPPDGNTTTRTNSSTAFAGWPGPGRWAIRPGATIEPRRWRVWECRGPRSKRRWGTRSFPPRGCICNPWGLSGLIKRHPFQDPLIFDFLQPA
jgi:hypothetical protein